MTIPEEVARDVSCDIGWNSAEGWTCLSHERYWTGEDEWCPVAVDAIREFAAAVAERAWDEGHAVATDEFVHSDYCGTRCQCAGLAGTPNPYKEPVTDEGETNE